MRATLLVAALVAVLQSQSHQLPLDGEVTPIKQFDVGAFLEGVVFDGDGFGYVSDVLGGAIYRFRPGGAPVLWAETSRPNGHKILADGTHVVADPAEHAIVQFDPDGTRQEPTVASSEGAILQAPNDITLDARGGYYFTDPRDSFRNGPTGKVHHVDENGRVRTVAAGLSAPNGLVLSPDAKTLYVSESRTNHILAFSVTDTGALENKRTLADLSGEGDSNQWQVLDGMTVDQRGVIYVAFGGLGRVYALSPSGDVVRRFPSGMTSVANVAFSPEADLLFVVGSSYFGRGKGSVYVLELPGIRGVSRTQDDE
jgi:gluconolactonase